MKCSRRGKVITQSIANLIGLRLLHYQASAFIKNMGLNHGQLDSEELPRFKFKKITTYLISIFTLGDGALVAN